MPILGLATVIYPVPDLEKAKAWYAKVFARQPYFDQPFYAGFDIAGYELGLVPDEGRPGPEGGVAYWRVEEINGAVARFTAAGAAVVSEAKDVGEGIKVATVADPFGNSIGLIENPHFGASTFTLHPIGVVRSPYTETAAIPKGQGAKHEAEGVLEIRPELEAGLADIEGFSHLIVVWVFHRSRGSSLVAHPPSDDRPHGVFATRSPERPNPIGLTVVRLLGRDGTALRVHGVDMLDGTPIIDIKPYLSSVPDDQIRRGWLEEAEARKGR